MMFDVEKFPLFEISATMRRVKTFIEMRLEYPDSKFKIHRELDKYAWLEKASYEELENIHSFLVFVSKVSDGSA